jgi:broad specificity phosphatase PhoE
VWSNAGVLTLVRHGRTAANAAGLLLGRLDPPLDEVGERQAVCIAAALGVVDVVVVSPLLRARQTAAAFATEVEVDERWLELDYGELDGRPVSSVGLDVWDRWRRDPDFVPAGGESLAAMAVRVTEACEALLTRAVDRHVVVVSHVSPIKAAVAWALASGPETAWRSHLDQASITRLGVTARGPVLRSFNEIAHLGDAPVQMRIEG